MNRPEADMTCERTLDLIEAYLDGELDASDRVSIELHIAACTSCADELVLARRVNAQLRDLPFEKCPPSVAKAVIDYATSHPQSKRAPWWRLVWRPALIGAVSAILLFATAYVGRNSKTPTPQYTRAELEQAREQAKWTLVFISQLSHKTASTLKRDVLEPHVVRKMMRVVDPKQDAISKENEHAS